MTALRVGQKIITIGEHQVTLGDDPVNAFLAQKVFGKYHHSLEWMHQQALDIWQDQPGVRHFLSDFSAIVHDDFIEYRNNIPNYRTDIHQAIKILQQASDYAISGDQAGKYQHHYVDLTFHKGGVDGYLLKGKSKGLPTLEEAICNAALDAFGFPDDEMD